MKNWLNYKDAISFENNAENSELWNRPQQKPEEIAAKYAAYAELPGNIEED